MTSAMDPEAWHRNLVVPSPPQTCFRSSISGVLLPVLCGALPVYTMGLALPLILLFLSSSPQLLGSHGPLELVKDMAVIHSPEDLLLNAMPYSLVCAQSLILLLGGDIETNPGPQTGPPFEEPARFPVIRDCASTKSVLQTLKSISEYYRRAAEQSKVVSEEAHAQAAHVLKPLAYFFQRRATEEQRELLTNSIAAQPEILDSFCDHTLFPFLKEINTHEPKLISGSSAGRLGVIKLVQVLLMEWSDCSNIMKERLVRSGCTFMLFKELRSLTRVLQLTTNEFAQHLIQAAATTISNCMDTYTDLHMKLYPDTDIEGSLKPYFRSPNPLVGRICKMTYHQFSHYLPEKCVDCPEDVREYVEVLHSASQNGEFEVIIDGRLVLEASGIIQILTCMLCSENNLEVLRSDSRLYSVVSNLLQRGREKEVRCVLHFLWKLLTIESSTSDKKTKASARRQQLLSRMPELERLIKEAVSVPELTSSLLWCISTDQDIHSDISGCLSYVQCCYKHKLYQQCRQWCDHARELSKKDSRVKALLNEFLLLKGKALCHIYQSQQLRLWRSERFKNTSELKQARQLVYSRDAKEVISILGSLNAKKVRDDEGDKLLDFALMDFIRELNEASGNTSKGKAKKKLTNVFYCMLCRNNSQICQSHIVPASILREVFGEDLYMKGPSGMSLEIERKKIAKATYYMLCEDCDNNTLSKDELLFAENVLRLVYDKSVPAQKVEEIPYEGWLYRFCAGMVFRGMALNRAATKSSNDDEVHQLFQLCRLVLLSKHLDVEEQKPIVMPLIALFFTPSLPEKIFPESEPVSSNFIRALNSSANFTFSNIPLSSTLPVIVKRKHFFLVHFGIFSIVALIGQSGLPPECEQFLVSPTGGTLSIPENDKRMDHNPPALKVLYQENAQTTVRDQHERPSAKTLSTKKTDERSSTKKRGQMPSAKEMDQTPSAKKTDQTPSAKVTDQMPPAKKINQTPTADPTPSADLTPSVDHTPSAKKPVRIIRTHLSEDVSQQIQETIAGPPEEQAIPHFLDFLPPKYHIDRRTNTVTLPDEHKVLLHDTLPDYNVDSLHDSFQSTDPTAGDSTPADTRPPHTGHTILLAISHETPHQPYVIIHSYTEKPKIFQSVAFSIRPQRFEFLELLTDAENIKGVSLNLFKLPSLMLDSVLQHSGLCNYQSLLYHQARPSTLDRKCLPGSGCWYCSNRCEMCMEVATPGLEVVMPRLEASLEVHVAMPDLETTTLGLEAGMPDLEPTTPGLEAAMPGLETTTPGLEAAMPDLEPTTSGLEGAMPDLEPTMPGLEAAMPDLEVTTPGLEAAMPDLEVTTPGLEAAMPDLEPTTPGLEVAMPDLETTTPGLEGAIKATTPGFILKFCSAKCRAFIDPLPHSQARFEPQEKYAQVTFKVLQPDDKLEEFKATQLLNVYYSNFHTLDAPMEVILDLYRVCEGDFLPMDRLFTLFHVRSLDQQVAGEFFVTEEIELGDPLPHVEIDFCYDAETLAMIGRLLRDGIAHSGIDVTPKTQEQAELQP